MDITVRGREIIISQNAPLHELCGRSPMCDRQGKSFTKPFNFTLVVDFIISALHLLSHVKRLGILEKVAVSRGNFKIQQFSSTSFLSYFPNFLKMILNVPRKTWDSNYRYQLSESKLFFPWRSTWVDITVGGGSQHFTKYPSPWALWEGSSVWPPGEKLNKAFQLDPGSCVSHFWTILTVSRGKIGNLRKSCASPWNSP